MAKEKNAKKEPKELKLVCKCGSCTHWEIILVRGAKDELGHEYLIRLSMLLAKLRFQLRALPMLASPFAHQVHQVRT